MIMQPCLRESVKQMVQEYEDNIRAPTPEFRGEPKIDDNIIPPPPKFRDEIKIAKVNKALKGAVQSHEVSIVNDKDPLLQLNGSSKHITRHLKQLVIEMKEFKQT